MKRDELEELHYITPIDNMPSIIQRGILSHNRAKHVQHQSIAMSEIQNRRKNVNVPGGRRLHDYVNLYICARNPMMFKRRDQYEKLCVLKISPDVVDLPGVVITDGNASGYYALFRPAPKGLAIVDHDLTFADDWRDPDQIQYYRKKAAKCAEVLVPDQVEPKYIIGAYLACRKALVKFDRYTKGIPATINDHIFFIQGNSHD